MTGDTETKSLRASGAPFFLSPYLQLSPYFLSLYSAPLGVLSVLCGEMGCADLPGADAGISLGSTRSGLRLTV